MASKLSNVLGIDIGSQTIKIAELRLQGRTPSITAIGLAETPEGAVDHIGVHDIEGVSAVCRQLMGAIGASAKDVVVSVAGQGSVLVRTIEVPNMNEGELKQHMDWEITRNIPFAESTVESDYQAYDASGQNLDVVMAMAPQSAVQNMVSLIKKTGKKPAAIDVEPLGLARTLAVCYEAELGTKSVCVVEVGHKTTAINMYRANRLVLPRQVPIGGEMMTRALADGFGVPMQEAEMMKRERVVIPDSVGAGGGGFNPFDAGIGAQTQSFAPYNPFADPDDVAAPVEDPVPAATDLPAPVAADDSEGMRYYNALAGVLDEFVAEVRRSVDYHRSKGGDVDEIVLAGGGAKLKGLDGFLERALGLPVRILDPLRGINLSAKKADLGQIEATKPDYAVAVGNCLHILF